MVLDRRKEARKRQKQRQKDAERGSGTADANEMADDEALLAQAEQTKPEMPDPWNENRVKKALEEHALACRRPPGEPKIYLELVTNHSTSANHEITQDNRELNRRNAVSKTKIFTRIFFNGKEVCQSSAKLLSSDFVVQVGQIFPIQILQLPESLTLQIIEGGTLKTTVLAEIKLPLCDSTQTLSEALLQPIEFKSDWKISHDHAGLGAGLNFPANYDGSEISHQTIQGKVFARVGWAKGVNGTILAPPIDQWNPKNDARYVTKTAKLKKTHIFYARKFKPSNNFVGLILDSANTLFERNVPSRGSPVPTYSVVNKTPTCGAGIHN